MAILFCGILVVAVVILALAVLVVVPLLIWWLLLLLVSTVICFRRCLCHACCCKCCCSKKECYDDVLLVRVFRLVIRSFATICTKTQGRKRHPNTKISPRIPCLNPPFSGAFNPRNSLCSGCVFSLKCRKKRKHKEF